MEPKIHVHLHSKDLARSRDFYRTFFGAEPVKEKPGYLKFLPAFAPLNLAISEDPAARIGGSVNHLGIQLDSTAEVLGHLARVKTAGAAVREELGVDCCHANQDKFWMTDPDGNEWEIYHLNHDLESLPMPARIEPAACCASSAQSCATGPGIAEVRS